MKQFTLLIIGLLCFGLAFSFGGCTLDTDELNSRPSDSPEQEDDDNTTGDPNCVPVCQALIGCFGETEIGTLQECLAECNSATDVVRECVTQTCFTSTDSDSSTDTDTMYCATLGACMMVCEALDTDPDTGSDTYSNDTDTDPLCPGYIPGSDDDSCCRVSDPCGWEQDGFCDCGDTCSWDSVDWQDPSCTM